MDDQEIAELKGILKDMWRDVETYKEVGFNGPFMMTHTPQFP